MAAVQQYTIKLERVGRVAEEQTALTQPSDAERHLRPLFADADREMFAVLALDARNRPIGSNVVSVGCLNASIVHPREVFKFAILANAAAIILAHNHPSGDLAPSADDETLTRKLVESGKILGIEVLDHLIVTEDDVMSFQADGWM